MTLPSYYIFFWPMLCLLLLFKVSKYNIHYHKRMTFINQQRAAHGHYNPAVDYAYLKEFGNEEPTFMWSIGIGLLMCLCVCVSWYGLMDIVSQITFVEKRKGLMIMTGKEYLILPSVMLLIVVFSVQYSLSLLRNFLDYCDFYATAHKLRLVTKEIQHA